MLSWDRRDSLLGMMRDALFPRGCAGCDRPDEVLCGDCRSLFANWRNRELVSGQETQGAVHTWSASTYQGVVRHAILAWKDHDDTELDTIFGEVMASLLEHSAIHRSCRRQTAVLVVPVPSSPASMRRRGRRHIDPFQGRGKRIMRLRLRCETISGIGQYCIGRPIGAAGVIGSTRPTHRWTNRTCL